MQTERERAAVGRAPNGVVTGRGPKAPLELSERGTVELVRQMNEHDRRVPEIVGAAAEQIASAVDAVVERRGRGGRLLYVGAGTSGGLAALDADECEATFSTEPGRVVAVVAGDRVGSAAKRSAAEDDTAAGAAALDALEVGPNDAVVG